MSSGRGGPPRRLCVMPLVCASLSCSLQRSLEAWYLLCSLESSWRIAICSRGCDNFSSCFEE